MFKRFSNKIKLSPSLGTSLINWFKVILRNGLISLSYILRALFITLFCIIGIPFRVFERIRFRGRIDSIKIKKPPIFIIGHWRSGTTFLHNLIVQDRQFGYITMLQALFPKSFMTTSFFRKFLETFMPDKRPMDNMRISINRPQEEELAMANLSPASFYNAFYFPNKILYNFNKYVKFEDPNPKIRKEWEETYRGLLKKATYNMGGKQLVLKNPSNMGRIKIILEMFPKAKFIHIYRNPYIVYLSTLNFYQEAIKFFMLQKISNSQIKKNVRIIYKKMMQSYFKQRELIPTENLVEIKFEELEKAPLKLLKNIYDTLNLKGFKKNKEKFVSYLQSISGYEKNTYLITKNVISVITKSWSSIIQKLDYSIPQPLS